MPVSLFRSLSIRKSAYLNACFFSTQIISRLDSQSKFQVFTLSSGRHIGVPRTDGFILGSVNFCETFRRSLGNPTDLKFGKFLS